MWYERNASATVLILSGLGLLSSAIKGGHQADNKKRKEIVADQNEQEQMEFRTVHLAERN
jgi:hypothetical protein